MSELISDLARRLVVGHKRDGRSIYDEQAKRELVLACREPGASIAKLARDCGVNANQVNSWVRLYERQLAKSMAPSAEVVVEAKTSAFVALEVAAAHQEEASSMVMQARQWSRGRLAWLRYAAGLGHDRGARENAMFRFDEGLKVYLHREVLAFLVVASMLTYRASAAHIGSIATSRARDGQRP